MSHVKEFEARGEDALPELFGTAKYWLSGNPDVTVTEIGLHYDVDGPGEIITTLRLYYRNRK